MVKSPKDLNLSVNRVTNFPEKIIPDYRSIEIDTLHLHIGYDRLSRHLPSAPLLNLRRSRDHPGHPRLSHPADKTVPRYTTL